MDPRLRRLQGKTELVTGRLSTLQEFYREKLTELLRHEAGARLIGQYDINNTYQYIISREETQLSWVRAAIEAAGGSLEEPLEPDRSGGGSPAPDFHAILEEDARSAAAFVERWRSRVGAVNNARHRGMLLVILGEVKEQQRSFEQALAGRLDLLGRRGQEVGARIGQVMSTRWIE